MKNPKRHLQFLLLTAMGWALTACATPSLTNPNIRYIRPEVPAVDLPPYKGEYKNQDIPDTLDLAHRAALAIHTITECTNPEYDHEVYINAYFNRNPPVMNHSYHDYNGYHPKIMEALPLLRLASGSTQNLEAEHIMLRAMLKMMGDDGLYYMPIKGRPWALFDDWGSFLANANPPEDAAHIAAMWPSGRALLALEAYSAADPENQEYDAFMKRMVDGFRAKLNDRGKWGYFPGDITYLNEDGELIAYSQSSYGGKGRASVDNDTPPITGLNAISFCSPVMQACAKYYARSKYEPAGEVASKLSYWIKDVSESFNPDGTFSNHFHLHLNALMGMLETGLVMNDNELIDFVIKSYEFSKTTGVPLVGHFPEHMPVQAHTTNEGCGMADMVCLAAMLSRAGKHDAWDDLDRWVRNEFAEMQITNTDWIDRVVMLEESKGTTLGNTPFEEANSIPDVYTTDRVKERSLGAFATWASINDWYPGWIGMTSGRFGWCGCCMGNGARAIYYAWESILSADERLLKVNLLLNRSSKWAEVKSHLPYEGRVQIEMKRTMGLEVRIPGWVDRNAIQVFNDGMAMDLTWSNEPGMQDHIKLGTVGMSHVVTIEFPMVEKYHEVDVPFPTDGNNPKHVRIQMRGNDVVDIWPKGLNAPFYQRSHYKMGETLWKQVETFSPDLEVDW